MASTLDRPIHGGRLKLTADEHNLMVRMSYIPRAEDKPEPKGFPVIGVSAQARADALRALVAKGYAKCWPGEGPDAGLMMGCMTATGHHAWATRNGPAPAAMRDPGPPSDVS